MTEVDKEHPGSFVHEVDDSKLPPSAASLASRKRRPLGAARVRISGLELMSGQGSTAHVANGDYERREQTYNGRALYCKEGGHDLCLWWSNVRGTMSWCVGPGPQAGREQMYAFTHSHGAGPEDAAGMPWFVYSYSHRAYLMQTGAQVVSMGVQFEEETEGQSANQKGGGEREQNIEKTRMEDTGLAEDKHRAGEKAAAEDAEQKRVVVEQATQEEERKKERAEKESREKRLAEKQRLEQEQTEQNWKTSLRDEDLATLQKAEAAIRAAKAAAEAKAEDLRRQLADKGRLQMLSENELHLLLLQAGKLLSAEELDIVKTNLEHTRAERQRLQLERQASLETERRAKEKELRSKIEAEREEARAELEKDRLRTLDQKRLAQEVCKVANHEHEEKAKSIRQTQMQAREAACDRQKEVEKMAVEAQARRQAEIQVRAEKEREKAMAAELAAAHEHETAMEAKRAHEAAEIMKAAARDAELKRMEDEAARRAAACKKEAAARLKKREAELLAVLEIHTEAARGLGCDEVANPESARLLPATNEPATSEVPSSAEQTERHDSGLASHQQQLIDNTDDLLLLEQRLQQISARKQASSEKLRKEKLEDQQQLLAELARLDALQESLHRSTQARANEKPIVKTMQRPAEGTLDLPDHSKCESVAADRGHGLDPRALHPSLPDDYRKLRTKESLDMKQLSILKRCMWKPGVERTTAPTKSIVKSRPVTSASHGKVAGTTARHIKTADSCRHDLDDGRAFSDTRMRQAHKLPTSDQLPLPLPTPQKMLLSRSKTELIERSRSKIELNERGRSGTLPALSPYCMIPKILDTRSNQRRIGKLMEPEKVVAPFTISRFCSKNGMGLWKPGSLASHHWTPSSKMIVDVVKQ